MAYSVSYNNIEISLTRTHELSFTPKFDEGGSYLYTTVNLAISGIVNPRATAYRRGEGGEPVPTPGTKPTMTITTIRHALAQPRGVLYFDAGDGDASSEPVLLVAPADNGQGVLADYPCDVNNGPVPGPLTITKIVGTKTFHITWSVRCHILECPSGITPTALLSNRYSQAHQVDQDHFTTITTHGQALFRTDILEDAQKLADEYRDAILPPVPLGFQRKQIQITATPSRNAITYVVMDREKAFDLGDTDPRFDPGGGGLPGSGIVDAHVTRELSSTGVDGQAINMNPICRVRIEVTGSKLSSNWRMTQACFAILSTMLPIGDPAAGYLVQIGVFQEVTGRKVGLQAAMVLTNAKAEKLGIIDGTRLMMDDIFPNQGGINPGFPNRGGTAGTYVDSAATAAWKSACQNPEKPKHGSPGEEGSGLPYEGSVAVQVSTSDELPDIGDGYSESTCARPYTDYKVSIVHRNRTFKMQVPLAGPVRPTSTSPGDGGSPGDSPSSSTGGPGGGGSYSAATGGGGDGGSDDGTPTCEFLTLARPMSRRIVSWTAERVNQQPEVPDPSTTDPNLVLIDDCDIQTEAPALMPDGVSLAYRVSGVYTYGLRKAKGNLSSLPMGLMPWMDIDPGSCVLGPDNFVDTIVDRYNLSSVGDAAAGPPPPSDPPHGAAN